MRRAAEQSYVSAQYHLALVYAKGKGVEQDLEKAFYWAKKSKGTGLCSCSRYTISYKEGQNN